MTASSYVLPGKPESLVLDTGPLFAYLMGCFVRRYPKYGQRIRQIDFARHPACMPRLLSFLDPVSRLLTTAGVLAEVNRLFRSPQDLPGPEKNEVRLFWGLAREIAESGNLWEESIPFLELDRDVLALCGPVDAALFSLAGKKKTGLMSEDEALRNACARADIHTIQIWDVVGTPQPLQPDFRQPGKPGTGDILVRVRYQETDRMGVVYHANHFIYFEMGRTELMRRMGIRYADLEAEGFALPVVEADARFMSPVSYDDEIVVETQVSLEGKTRVRFDYRAFLARSGRPVSDGFTRHVFVGSDRRTPVRIPDRVRNAVEGPPASRGETSKR
jgi:acyl-CoA thioester hydrolase